MTARNVFRGVALGLLLTACGESAPTASTGESEDGSSSELTIVTMTVGDVARSYSFPLDCLDMDPMFQFTAKDPDAGIAVSVVKSPTGGFNLDLDDGQSRWTLSNRSDGAHFNLDNGTVRLGGQAKVIVDNNLDRTDTIGVTVECR